MSRWTPTRESDLRAFIRDLVKRSEERDPVAVAAEIRDCIPEERLVEALDLALPVLVRQMIQSQRGVRPRHWSTYKKQRNRDRAWRDQVLRTRLAVGVDDHAWKFLGECEADDLRRAAMIRREMAERNQRAAARLEGLADAMERLRFHVPSEMDDETLSFALGDGLDLEQAS